MNNGDIRRVEADGFVGDVIGVYVTREGHRGFVLQQLGTRVVHVYRADRCLEMPHDGARGAVD